MWPGPRGGWWYRAQVLVEGWVPVVDLGEVVLEFGMAELVDSSRLTQHLAVVGVF
jgi:hypothetical protein